MLMSFPAVDRRICFVSTCCAVSLSRMVWYNSSVLKMQWHKNLSDGLYTVYSQQLWYQYMVDTLRMLDLLWCFNR